MPTTEKSPSPSKELNFRLDLDALEILERFAPKKSHMKGRFLSRLIYEHAVRVEERQRGQDRSVGGGKDDHGEAA